MPEKIVAWLEHRRFWVIGLFSAIFLLVSILLGATKLMNFDELFTYNQARQATVGEIWSFSAEGLEIHTPIYPLLVHASMAVFGVNAVSLRVPVILGFWAMCLAIYAFLSYRCSPIYALAGMMFPVVTSVYFYATEGRPYGAALGTAAIAVLCWQRVTSQQPRAVWLAGLALALTTSLSLHYFAVFLWIPLGLGALIRDWQKRSIDWALWAVLVGSLFPLAIFLPMIQAARANYLSGVWAKPGLGDIENTYRSILTLAFAPLLGIGVLWMLLPADSGGSRPLKPSPPLAEKVMMGALVLMPFFVVPIMMLGGTFVPRYILFTLVGITLVFFMGVYRRAAGSPMFALAAILCLAGWFLLKYPNAARGQLAESQGLLLGEPQPFKNKPWMRAIEQRPDLPVIVSPAVFYLPFRHYGPPEVRQRTYYLTSVKDALRLDGSDTGEKNLLFFLKRFPIQVPAYKDFVGRNREFLLLAETTNPTWVIEKLLDDGARLNLIFRDHTYFLYYVAFPAPSSTAPDGEKRRPYESH